MIEKRSIIGLMVDQRSDSAVNVQKILTGWGCIIKTRLGLHDGILDTCTQSGLIILEVIGEEAQKLELVRKLNLLKGVVAQQINLELDIN